MSRPKREILADILCPHCAENLEKLEGSAKGFPTSRVSDAEISAALAATGGHRSKAAKLLGISRRTIQNRVKSHTEPHGA